MLDALQFETEIKGTAIKTLEEIEKKLKAISEKTTINIEVQGVQEFQNFVKSEDFKNVAKNISSAFGGQKAKNVTQFFTNLRTEIEKVKSSLQSGDYSAFMTQISQLTQQFGALNIEYQKFLKGSGAKTGDDVIANMSSRLKEVERAISQLDPAYKKLQQKQEKLEKQQDKLAKKQEELANNMKNTTKEADKQSNAFSGLQNMMNKYLSVYGIYRFAKEMAVITGELELQKRSLEVIVGNASAANELYGTIRDMSQMSPYTFQDLMKSTRQLSAFGIETKDLYDTMKALSDIGAGLSVDVQRLILAYGHTRSYGYLSGIQNRQFETAGVDMIGGLVKRYNELADAEEKAGRAAERVTRQDIFKRMSKREISFEDVNAVIMDLDREGGKFFNMQERQFETLGGKLRNLRNNWNIMMSEMGEQNKGILKGGVNILNELTGNWERYATVIKSLIIPLGSLKIAMIAANRATQEGVSLLSPQGLANVKKGFTTMATSLKTIFRSAFTWISAAIAAVTMLIQHMNKVNKMAKSFAETMREGGKNDEQAIRSVMDTYGGEHVRRIQENMGFKDGVQILKYRLEFDKDQLSSMNLTGAIEDIKEKLQALSPMYAGDLVDIDSIDTQYEQFKAYMQKLEDLRYANDITEAYSAAFELANKNSAAATGLGRMFNDDFLTDVQDYQRSLRKSADILQNVNDETLNRIDESMNGALTRIKQSMGYVDLRDALRDYMLNVMNAYNAAAEEADKARLGTLAGNGSIADPVLYNRNGWATKNPELAGVLPDRRGVTDFLQIFQQFLDPGLFVPYLDEQRAEMYKGAKPFADAIMDVIRNNYADNTEGAIQYVATQLKIIKNQSGATDEKVIEELYDSILSYMGEEGEKYKEAFDREKVITRFNTAIADKINARTTDEEAAKIREEAVEGLKEWATNIGIDLAKIGGKDGELFVKAMAAAMSDVKLRTDWQERLIGPTGIIQINTGLANDLKKTYDVVEGAEMMQKEFDDLMKKFDTSEDITQNVLKKFFGTDYKVDELTNEVKADNNQLKSALEKRISILQSLLGNLSTEAKKLQLSDNIDEQKEGYLMADRLKNEVEPTLKLYQMVLEIITGMTSIGADLKTTKGSTKIYHDEEAKRWDERIRIMKEAYDWYDKWDKKVGESEAFKKVDERYRDIFDEWKTDKLLPFDFQATDIKDYFKYIEDIRDQALAKYQQQKNDESKGYGQEALRVYRQAVATLEEGGYDNFIKAAEKFQSIIEKTMDDLQRRWGLFTDIRDKTGNVGLAASLSGVDTSFRTQADAMRDAVQQAYSEAGGSSEVNFDVSLDKEAVRAMFEDAISGDKNDVKYMESIDGLIKGFEEWQNAQEEQEKMDINVTVDLISNAVDVQSEVLRITSDYNRQYNALNRLFPNGGPEFDKANSILAANTNAKIVQAQQSYKFLMDGVTTMNIKAAKQIKKDYEDALLKQLKSGAITAKQYADEIQNINDKMRELENAPSYFRSFTQNGLQGVFENMQQRGKGDVEQGGAQLQEAQRLYQLADELLDKYEGTGNAVGMRKAADMFQNAKAAEAIGMNMIASGSAKMKGGGGALQTLATIDAIINGINKMVQSLKSFADYIKQVNVALGKADADEWSNSDNFLYAFSNASQQAANGWNSLKEGDIIGALQGTYGSWAEWWKSYAEGEDKTREYQIKLSERQLKVLSNMASRLDKINERTLGYGGEVDQATWDKFNSVLGNWTKAQNGETYYTGKTLQKSAWGALGSILLPFFGGRIAENIYDKQNTKQYSSPYSDATVAAIESALQTGSLYAAQYAAKMMERDELESQLKQLEAENKKDDARIEETKQKLWDVKQELAYWTEDLAKELWGIDIKGWADQISSALTNAFANGENAAKAFDDTVRSIMQNVVNEIIKVGLIEPMMDDLRKTLFGTKNEKGEYEGGAITTEMIRENPKQAGEIAAAAINQWRKDRGDNMILGTQEVWTGINAGLGGFLTNPNANTLSASIRGTSEETSDLLAGYVSALRQDVAADRIMREQFINEMWPTFVEETMGAVITPLNNIDRNVAAIRQSMTGQGELMITISDIYGILNAITNGTKEIHMA